MRCPHSVLLGTNTPLVASTVRQAAGTGCSVYRLATIDSNALPDNVLPGTHAPLEGMMVRQAAGMGPSSLSRCQTLGCVQVLLRSLVADVQAHEKWVSSL